MTKNEVIKKFCDLSSKVADKVFKSQKASDCFCTCAMLGAQTNKYQSKNFNFEREVVEFIEKAVENAMTKNFPQL